MKVIFLDPKNTKIASFLKDNIEDEFRLEDWSLKMEFVSRRPGLSRLEFKAGVTPHVNKLGGNIITMDKAASIDEYDIKWTIRHEYGHILGLPDCYFEFFDEKIKWLCLIRSTPQTSCVPEQETSTEGSTANWRLPTKAKSLKYLAL